MAAIAVYIAVGSGCAGVRESLEMNELQFFNAWPLKVLMASLVVNLATVTWTRIPFTPPRYGVWCIHAGIVVLIVGTSLYYHYKVEGTTLLPLSPPADTTARYFYDSTERCLYAEVIGGDKARGGTELFSRSPILCHPLPSLPRFGTYEPRDAGVARLRRDDLQNISDFTAIDTIGRRESSQSLQDAMGLPTGVKIDVLGYYPYAEMTTRFVPDASSDETALSLTAANPSGKEPARLQLCAGDPRFLRATSGDAEFEHVKWGESCWAAANDLKDAVCVHRLRVCVGGAEVREIPSALGTTYAVGSTGYFLTPFYFDPAWSMFGTGRRVRALALRVTPPGGMAPFNRMVLEGEPTPTDFSLRVSAGEPTTVFGVRQATPLDDRLYVRYRLDDALRLPRDAASGGEGVEATHLTPSGRVKHTLITTAGRGVVDVAMWSDRAPEITVLPEGTGTLPDGVVVDRRDHVRAEDEVIAVPENRRRKGEAQAGTSQVLRVRVSSGAWSREAALPFSQYPLPPVGIWSGPVVHVPGAGGSLRLELGNTPRPLPVDLALERFDVVPYPGGRDAAPGLFRDVLSTVRLTDPATGATSSAVARLNGPVYFAGGRWLFFQHSFDSQGRRWAVLGVGTRPAVGAMIAGSAMIVAGLLYAFYVKPVIIQRMKRRAVKRAGGTKLNCGRISPPC